MLSKIVFIDTIIILTLIIGLCDYLRMIGNKTKDIDEKVTLVKYAIFSFCILTTFTVEYAVYVTGSMLSNRLFVWLLLTKFSWFSFASLSVAHSLGWFKKR